jgi:hypothetical protein
LLEAVFVGRSLGFGRNKRELVYDQFLSLYKAIRKANTKLFEARFRAF